MDRRHVPGRSRPRGSSNRKSPPLVSRRRLGCHDAASRQGGLDLSTRESALAGGANGNAVIPGSPESSLVWLMAESEAMLKGLAPLSAGEKRVPRDCIEEGAGWSLDRIDTAIYSRSDRAKGNWISRLTVPEYIETVRGVLGVDAVREARELLPPDVRADGFENTAYNLNVDLSHVEACNRLAALVASRVNDSVLREEDASVQESIPDLARRVLRGVVTEQELSLFSGLAASVTANGGRPDEAMKFVLEAILQWPRFLYRVELQRGYGSSWPADGHEIASRLSYPIWGAAPDPDLLERASSGRLGTDEEVSAQIDRMLDEPRAVERSL